MGIYRVVCLSVCLYAVQRLSLTESPRCAWLDTYGAASDFLLRPSACSALCSDPYHASPHASYVFMATSLRRRMQGVREGWCGDWMARMPWRGRGRG